MSTPPPTPSAAESASRFKDLLSILTTIKGDLSSTLSPPFLLAPKSMTELPTAWIERPSLFAAPALEPDPAKRALLVLKWFVVSLRALLYTGEDSKLGMKKPLNPFLGELCIESCADEGATARLVVEQVSHHPPIGACYFWDEVHGIQCEGFSRVQMTFNGSINIKQIGRSVLHIDAYDEYYSIPILDAKVVGFFSGQLYPELAGKYSIVSSSGYISEMDFCGKGFWTGEKNHVSAKVYHRDTGPESPLYTLSGQWSSKFDIRDCNNDAFSETFDMSTSAPVPMNLHPEKEQDQWETRKAWGKVHEALGKGDMQATTREKSRIEEAQRAMRKREASEKQSWQPLFFTKSYEDEAVLQRLLGPAAQDVAHRKPEGLWRVRRELARNHLRPFHGALTPGEMRET